MILGIGTDIVRVNRFLSWQKFSDNKLKKVFSEEELNFCKQKCKLGYDLSRLASRYAAKEAFFKALSATLVNLGLTDNKFSFLFLCKNISIKKKEFDIPYVSVNWGAIEKKICNKLPKLSVNLSISHEKSHAIAFIVISGE